MVLLFKTIPFLACAAANRGAQAPGFDEAMPCTASQDGSPEDTQWVDAETLGILGRGGWPVEELPSPYTRFPSKAKEILCGAAACASSCVTNNCENQRCVVWGLSQTATGLHVRFASTATDVHVRWAMEHEDGDWLWPINGHSGVDFYVQDASTSGAWRWGTSSGNNGPGGNLALAVMNQPDKIKKFTASLGSMAAGQARNFTLYFPSRGSVKSVEIGVGPGASVERYPNPVDATKPVAVYGTSILHSAAVGRAGMTWSSQMERYTGLATLNFGFSGHGLMQQEVGALLSEVDASLFVLDCEWNMDGLLKGALDPSAIECLTHDFIKLLREKRPEARVLLIEGHDDTRAWMDNSKGASQNATRNGYRAAFNRLLDEGEDGVFFLDGSLKLGGPTATSFEAQVGAVSGVHVTDLTFTHFAHYVGDAVLGVLNGTAQPPEKVSLLPVETITSSAPPPILQWLEAKELGIEGLGWLDGAPKYGRLPYRAKADVTEQIWSLGECSAGVLTRFETDAASIAINVVRDDNSSQFHGVRQDDIMSWNGRFGLDVYAEDTATGKWRWFATSGGGSQQVNETLQLDGLVASPSGKRRFTVHFPTHAPVISLRVGVPSGASLEAYRPYAGQKPILVGGSSIAQGGVVQNSGLQWPVAMGRILDREVLNFGFSGNCRMQPEVARYLLELKPALFIVDCLPNMNADAVDRLAPALLRQLREALGHDVPIAVLEGHTYTNAWLLPSVRNGQQAKRAAQLAAFNNASGPNLHYIPGDGKLASLGESQFDASPGIGVHPSNIAHLRIAEFVAEQVRPLLAAADRSLELTLV